MTLEARERSDAGATVDHVPNFRHRYPGESVVFYTRVTVSEPDSNLILRIHMPPGLRPSAFHPPAALPDADTAPSVVAEGDSHQVVWRLGEGLAVGVDYEFRTEAVVDRERVIRDTNLMSEAVLSDWNPSDSQRTVAETAVVRVATKGRYLRHLPELYAQDELMGRFLMLFESFWKPIDVQIDGARAYVNPEMTPSEFLPWLASWVDLALDERIPEERQRRLIRDAVPIFRRRGTRQGLRDFLEIYTGGKASIREYRANNFVLGKAARLGPGIALGRRNVPHTFAVHLRLPPPPTQVSGEEAAQFRARQRRLIEGIIDAEKPAHTSYSLELEFEPTS